VGEKKNFSPFSCSCAQKLDPEHVFSSMHDLSALSACARLRSKGGCTFCPHLCSNCDVLPQSAFALVLAASPPTSKNFLFYARFAFLQTFLISGGSKVSSICITCSACMHAYGAKKCMNVKHAVLEAVILRCVCNASCFYHPAWFSF